MDISIVKFKLEKFGDEIEKAIAAADWSSLSELLTERQCYLEKLFGGVVPEAVKAELKTILQAMLAKDEQWLQIINRQKKQMYQKIQMLDQGQRSIQLYRNNE